MTRISNVSPARRRPRGGLAALLELDRFPALRLLAALALFVSSSALAFAQRPPAQLDGAAILHRLHKLEVVGSVLYVAAHPDDENTRLISYLSNGAKVRTAYLSLTRGDGGQNLIGPELGDALGILRTQELLEARRIDGGEQFFTRAVDFGYSKSAEETFAKWGREEVLGDVVRVVRMFRPDVIVTRFATDGSGGHGHHTASARLANEAFELAADPRAYPEQLKQGLEPWQAKRVFFNASSWWRRDVAEVAAKDPANWIAVDVGGFDPLLGLSYTELAGRSRSQHKSQGFGAAETRGEQLEYLQLSKGPPLRSADLFDGIELSWKRIPGSEPVQNQLRELIDTYDPHQPELSAPKLEALARTLDELAASKAPGAEWARRQADAARQLALQACGAFVEASSPVASVPVGGGQTLTLSAMQRSSGPALEVAEFTGPGAAARTVQVELTRNRLHSEEFAFTVDPSQPIDEPYWLAAPHDALYRPDTSRYAGVEPSVPGAALFHATVRLPGGSLVRVERPAMHTWVDRVAGERTRPFVVTPIASLEVVDAVAIVTGERATIEVEIEALADELDGVLEATTPPGWSVERGPAPVEKLRRGERRKLSLVVRRSPQAVRGALRLAFSGPKGRADRTLHVIDYPHILPQTWYTPAEVLLVPQDVAVNVDTVGYIEGAGDDVPKALARLGVNVVRIDAATAQAADLAACDAIVTGIRAYNTVRALTRFQATLMEYVEQGGTVLVQYNTNGSDLVMDAKRIGPHPFALTRQRVTVEEAPPTFLAPNHPLLNVPNKLGASDFEGWVQERGLYFAGELDSKYTPLIAWSDPGEAPLDGALITCDYGKGRFTYTGISLFRQLPAGVPGAYRLLANLIARRDGGE